MAPEQAEGAASTAPPTSTALGARPLRGARRREPRPRPGRAATARRVGMRLPALTRLRPDLPPELCAALDTRAAARPGGPRHARGAARGARWRATTQAAWSGMSTARSAPRRARRAPGRRARRAAGARDEPHHDPARAAAPPEAGWSTARRDAAWTAHPDLGLPRLSSRCACAGRRRRRTDRGRARGAALDRLRRRRRGARARRRAGRRARSRGWLAARRRRAARRARGGEQLGGIALLIVAAALPSVLLLPLRPALWSVPAGGAADRGGRRRRSPGPSPRGRPGRCRARAAARRARSVVVPARRAAARPHAAARAVPAARRTALAVRPPRRPRARSSWPLSRSGALLLALPWALAAALLPRARSRPLAAAGHRRRQRLGGRRSRRRAARLAARSRCPAGPGGSARRWCRGLLGALLRCSRRVREHRTEAVTFRSMGPPRVPAARYGHQR